MIKHYNQIEKKMAPPKLSRDQEINMHTELWNMMMTYSHISIYIVYGAQYEYNVI